jgi:peroxiredoxin
MPLVQQLYEKYRDKGLIVITINSGGSPSAIAKFLAKRNYTFTTLSDLQSSAAHDYHIQYVPTTFFIDRDGFIRDKVIGGFENMEQIEQRLSKITQ